MWIQEQGWCCMMVEKYLYYLSFWIKIQNHKGLWPRCAMAFFYELPRRFSLFAAQKDIQIGKQRYFLHFCNRQFVVVQYFWRLISWEFPTWNLAIGRQQDKNQYSKLSKSWQTQWSGVLLMGGRLFTNAKRPHTKVITVSIMSSLLQDIVEVLSELED